MELIEILEQVNDEKTFLDFARALLAERCEDIELEKSRLSSPFSSSFKGWENITLESFLEAAISWAEDSEFGKMQTNKDNLWYKFALFLYCGKIYE